MKLEDPVTVLPQIKSQYSKHLERLGIFTVKDLLTYFPVKYIDTSVITSIKDLIYNNDFENTYQIKVKIVNFRSAYLKSHKTIQTSEVADESGEITLMWFNQDYLKDVLKPDKEFIFSGKIRKDKNGRYQFNPSLYEEIIEGRELVHLARFTPEYALTTGVSKKWFRNRIKYLVDHMDELEIPNEMEEVGFKTEDLKKAIYLLHFPESLDDLEKYYELLSLYELVNIQLKLEQRRAESAKLQAPKIDIDFKVATILDGFRHSLPFELTEDQHKVTQNIQKLMADGNVLNELIQGDVGSGKTIVAIISALITALNNYQSVILAPTTILAKQHHATFSKMLENFNIKAELVTSENKKTESEKILIGTSAVLARKKELITNLGLVIVDEQHKFGVAQREELLEPFEEVFKGKYYPHFINMTATPIPRTIAQAFFGDVSISFIKTKPKGRLPISTHLVPPEKREDSYKWIDEKVEAGEQVYWICPLISESEKIEAKSAEETYEHLRAIFPHRKIALLHGKMKEAEKAEVMRNFLEHKADILVSTSVIEVGIDVPNATVMVIESAERFGLAQLHQIRGRVGRSDKQSWCFLFYSDNISRSAIERLKYLASSNDGLEIAEYDLKLRGPGEIYGTKQSGIPFLKIAKLDNLELIKKSKQIAEKLYNQGIRKIELFN